MAKKKKTAKASDGIQQVGKCIEEGHEYHFSAIVLVPLSIIGAYYPPLIIEVCHVCGYSRKRAATRKECKALELLGIDGRLKVVSRDAR